jgi:hypothetical protein
MKSTLPLVVFVFFATTGAVCGSDPSPGPKSCNPPCYAFENCDATNGTCVTASCSRDTDCGPGAICTWLGRCAGYPCTTHAGCNDGKFCNGVETCDVDPTGTFAKTCRRGTPPCHAPDVCDEANDTCVRGCPTPDADGDGHASYACGGDDCDDNDPQRYPGNVEVCDAAGHDEDCDPTTFGRRDVDGDGYADALCCNTDLDGVTKHCGNDCNDSDSRIHPNQPEVCNHKDDDCNGVIDDGVTLDAYYDYDRDGAGAPGTPTAICPNELGQGYSPFPSDCDDKNSAIHPGEMKCGATTTEVLICQRDGTWTTTACGPQQVCVTQPNGTGVCR